MSEMTLSRWGSRPSGNALAYPASQPQKVTEIEESTDVEVEAHVAEPSSSTPPATVGGTPEAKPTVVQQPGRPGIRIYGEPFHVEHEGETYYIVHDRWSLMGSGPSLAAAYKDLLFEGSEVAPVYIRTPASELDYEGQRFAKFLLRFI